MKKTDGRLCFGLTDAGKMVLRGTGFVALAVLIVPAFGVLSALVSVVLMALLVGFVLRPKIHISGNLPDRVIVGQTVRLKYVLKNVARLPAYNLCVRFAPKGVPAGRRPQADKPSAPPETIEQVGGEHLISRLGPGETTEVTIATNLPFESWTEVCGSERLTGALLDRLTHRVHIIEANGASYRLEQSRKRLARQKKISGQN
ncbi:MAG: ATP-binding protein [Planctomycetota bacterium]